MATTAADVMMDILADWGVDVVFGLPGDGINGLMEALRTRRERIRFIQVRHEEPAAFMACAYAKYTGKLGCCLATSGPGGVHLMNGLYDAKMDRAPVLAITGHHYHDLIDTHAQQDIDLDVIFRDLAVYSTRIMGPEHVSKVTPLACRNALAHRGVAHINFPTDFQGMACKNGRPSKRGKHFEATAVFARDAGLPAQANLAAAANLLNQGKKIVIMAGQGAIGAGDELEQLAEVLAAPIVKPLLGKACVPDDSPYTTGGVGLLGTAPSQKALEICDTLLLVGTSFPYLEFYPDPDKAKGIQIDADPSRIGLRYPVEVGLVGDSRRTLQSLLPLLKKNKDRRFLHQAQEGAREWRQLMEERGTRQEMPMKPQVVAWALDQRLRDDAIVSADSGTITSWFARHLTARKGQMFSVSGTLASMGNALPYAIAAQIAYPERQCIAFAGDGGLTMLMGELATAVKYQLPIKIIVFKNNTLGMIKWEQMVFEGNPEYGCELQPIDFAGVARACGVRGFTIERPEDCGAILDEALAVDGPALIEAVVDPFEPPMPPKITADQALKLTEALIKGEPNREKIALTLAADRIRELV
ncbi:MAG: thiamine pyrophosphate-dependent enzyme [Actinomycetota bacterium]